MRGRCVRAACLSAITLPGIGCGPIPQPSPPDPKPLVEQASGPVRSGADVAGQWDVVSFEGYRPRRLTGTSRAAFADFDENGVRLRMECNYSGRAGIVVNGRFRPARTDDGMQTVMSCGLERNAREGRFFGFFDKASTIERLGAEGLRLRGGGTELVLERPARRRFVNVPTPAEMRGSWRMVELTRYLAGGGRTGSGLSDVPGRIVITDGRLTYSRCPQYGVAFRVSPTGRLVKTSDDELPKGPRECRELSAPSEAPMMPALWDILRLLHSSPAIERTEADSLLLSTDEFGLLITRAPCQSLDQSSDHRSSTVGDCASPV